ncbi:MAG: hypothetical protein H7Z12_15140 [Rhodospirillaceae bacterium]|nr:hypothetical protein [Rhodospirillales bacterium]
MSNEKVAIIGVDPASGPDSTVISIRGTSIHVDLTRLAEPAGPDAFETIIGDLLADEGGDKLTNRLADKGGLTRWGISKRAHPDVDVANLTRDGAVEIYRAKYFDAARIADLPVVLAKLVFDGAVNHGVPAATFMLQSAYNAKASGDNRLKMDGVIGDKTLAAIAALDSIQVLDLTMLFCAERMKRYGSDATWSANGNGWSNRLFGNITQALMQGVTTETV